MEDHSEEMATKNPVPGSDHRLRSSCSNPSMYSSGQHISTLRASCSNPLLNSSGQRVSSNSSSTNLGWKADEENVRVIVRVRPMSKNEEEKQYHDITLVDQNENAITVQKPTGSSKKFQFDAVFAPDSTQAELFNLIARPVIYNVIEGYNGTIFAYGQTGTGKTFTMEGDRNCAELKGIIPNSFAQIFSHISKESDNSKFLVHVSYLEIYNEDVRDLLAKDASKRLEIKEKADIGVYVKDLSYFVVRNEQDMEKILKAGNKNRVVGTTNMNIESSRSHAIFSINIECSSDINGERSLRKGKLNLVDLAGSERVSKTGASGHRLKEGAKINMSLSCLGNVISALVEGQQHIPYRSSKLTRLLQDSLGGNSKTVMIANVGPADYNYDETISTLRYADRAKQIKNHAHINEDPKDALLRQFEQQIEDLRRQLELEILAGNSKPTDDIFDDDQDIADVDQGTSFLIPNDETLLGIKGEIETQEKLSSAVKMEAESKQTTLHALKENVISWKEQQEKKSILQEKLASLQKKIMVGGENLLDKSQQQETFLQNSMKELEERRKQRLRLQTSLTSKIAEKALRQDTILKLQKKSRKTKSEIRKAVRTLEKEQLESQAIKDEQDAEKNTIIMEINRMTLEVNRTSAILNKYIPQKHLKTIKRAMTYNEDTQSWDIPCIAYAGNHVEYVNHCHPPPDRTKKMNIEGVYQSLHDLDSNNEVRKLETFSVSNYVNLVPQRTSTLTQEEILILERKIPERPTNFNIDGLIVSSSESEDDTTEVMDLTNFQYDEDSSY